MFANFILGVKRLGKEFRGSLNQYFYCLINIFIGPFVCVGYWVPNIQSRILQDVSFNHHSRIVTLICLVITTLLFNFTYAFSGLISLQIAVYGLYLSMKFLFPKGLVLGQVRLFASISYEYIDRIPSMILHRGRVLSKHVLDQSVQGRKFVVHCLGSGDSISTYVARLWGHNKPKGELEDEGVFHICIEQPGISTSKSFLGRIFQLVAVLFMLSFKFWCHKLGVYPSIIIFALLVPNAYKPFYIRRYANSVQTIMQYLSSKGVKTSDISLSAFSLGGVAVMLWRKLYDKAASIKICLDRSPQVQRIHMYGANAFFLPATAVLCTVFMSLSLCTGFYFSLSSILMVSVLLVFALALFKSLRAPVLRFALKVSGNWSGLCSLNNLKVFNAEQDHVLGKAFRFNAAKDVTQEFSGDHMSTPSYDSEGDITGYSNDNKAYHNLVNMYERVVSCVITRQPKENTI